MEADIEEEEKMINFSKETRQKSIDQANHASDKNDD